MREKNGVKTELTRTPPESTTAQVFNVGKQKQKISETVDEQLSISAPINDCCSSSYPPISRDRNTSNSGAVEQVLKLEGKGVFPAIYDLPPDEERF